MPSLLVVRDAMYHPVKFGCTPEEAVDYVVKNCWDERFSIVGYQTDKPLEEGNPEALCRFILSHPGKYPGSLRLVVGFDERVVPKTVVDVLEAVAEGMLRCET